MPIVPHESSRDLTIINGSILKIFFLCFILSGCGYRWQPDFPNGALPTIVVPFVIGDEDGSLTNAIARTLSCSNMAILHHRRGDYRLEVKIIESHLETTGFRRDKQKIESKIKKNLLAAEARKWMTVEAILYEGDSDRIAYGPYQIEADTDYDYYDGDSLQDLAFINSEGRFTTVLPFSLGQLESTESAQEASLKPLYSKIAQKIVDVISSEW